MTRIARILRAGCVPALAASLLFLATAPAAQASDWKVQRLSFPLLHQFDTLPVPLLAISCRQASFCAAVGHTTHIAVSATPGSGPAAWQTFLGPEGGDYDGPPAPPGAPPNRITPSLKGVACPSVRLCVAVSGNGDVYASSDPTGGTSAWPRTDIDGDAFETHLEGVACPTVTFCVAVSGGERQNNNPRTSGKILSSHDPAGGSSAWHETQLDPSFDLRGVSCASPALCLAVGRDGKVVVSTNPDGPPSAWRDLGSPGGPGHLQGVECVPGLCLAGSSGGNILASTDPAAAPSVWSERNGGASVPITGISCPSADACLAVDNNGNVLTSTNPIGGAEAWSIQSVLPYVPKPEDQPALNGMFGVSCPSTRFCAIAAADGTVLTSSNPFTGPAATAVRRKARRAKRPRTILARVDRRHRARTARRGLKVLFRFYSRGKPRKFLCKHDGGPWRSCQSPHRYWVERGKHVFRVRAVGYTGLEGPIALDRFRIYSPDDKCPCARP